MDIISAIGFGFIWIITITSIVTIFVGIPFLTNYLVEKYTNVDPDIGLFIGCLIAGWILMSMLFYITSN